MEQDAAGSSPGRPTGRFWANAAADHSRKSVKTSTPGVSSVNNSAVGKGGSWRHGSGWSRMTISESFGKSREAEPENRVYLTEAEVPRCINRLETRSSSVIDMELDKKDSKGSLDPGDSMPPGDTKKVEAFDIFMPSSGTSVVLKPSLLAKNREKRNEMKRSMAGPDGRVLRPGMVLIKNYLSISDQVKIANLCREVGRGPGGFYQPGYRDGAKLHLKMMCLGKNWDPETSRYGEQRPVDGTKPPEIPDLFRNFVKKAIEDCHSLIRVKTEERSPEQMIPWMLPNICIVNFYSSSGRLGLHQDRDESEVSLRKGLPVISFSIGDTAEFVYGDERDAEKAEKVSLESGDLLVFGGKSRHIFHGIKSVTANSAPKILSEETRLRPGRLNLTFREY